MRFLVVALLTTGRDESLASLPPPLSRIRLRGVVEGRRMARAGSTLRCRRPLPRSARDPPLTLWFALLALQPVGFGFRPGILVEPSACTTADVAPSNSRSFISPARSPCDAREFRLRFSRRSRPLPVRLRGPLPGSEPSTEWASVSHSSGSTIGPLTRTGALPFGRARILHRPALRPCGASALSDFGSSPRRPHGLGCSPKWPRLLPPGSPWTLARPPLARR